MNASEIFEGLCELFEEHPILFILFAFIILVILIVITVIVGFGVESLQNFVNKLIK